MKKRKLLFTLLALSLGCFFGGGEAMAQNGWESIYQQTQTLSDDWTAITESTTQGKILGAAQSGSNATYYYYVTKSLNFTNNRTDNDGNGNSGLKIHGTVYLYVPAGLTITCEGANADGRTGAGAGIELASGNTLYIIGGGTVNATGGKAENGRNGGDGTDASGNSSELKTGTGGSGGNGGGGAGAGIGTRGGTGGTGGSGGYGYTHDFDDYNGTDGSDGTGGGSAGAMGNLYVANGITVTATGGNAGSSGAGGGRGKGYIWDGGNNYTVAGGGGGGAGGFGGAAANIGTGGPGGGGGGGGAGGAQDWKGSQLYDVTAYGGNGGTNGDGTSAANGAEANTTRSAYEHGLVVSANSSYTWQWNDWNSPSGDCTFGSGGAGGGKGNNASGGTQNTGNLTYNITYYPIKTNINGKTGETLNSLTVTYSPGAPNIILPANTEGYNWVLTTYGKSCAPNGVAANTFATATDEYFGGNGDETSRTITPINVYGDLVFQEVATMLMMECSTSGENPNNDQDIAEFYTYGYKVTTRLQNRTLYRDGHWNTICLPFAMTPAQIAASPLAGATIMKMNESVSGYYDTGKVNKTEQNVDYGHPVVLFWFNTVKTNSESLEAGQPYLVKWTEIYEHTADGNYVDNTSSNATTKRHELDFPGVTISVTQPGSWTGIGTGAGNVTFQGTFSLSADLDETDSSSNMNLVLGADDKLYYPSSTINVGACRGYFKIPSAAVSAAPQFVMGFDDGETTSIQVVKDSGLKDQGSDTYYNLNGQRLSAPKKGINIVNGKKVVIK